MEHQRWDVIELTRACGPFPAFVLKLNPLEGRSCNFTESANPTQLMANVPQSLGQGPRSLGRVVIKALASKSPTRLCTLKTRTARWRAWGHWQLAKAIPRMTYLLHKETSLISFQWPKKNLGRETTIHVAWRGENRPDAKTWTSLPSRLATRGMLGRKRLTAHQVHTVPFANADSRHYPPQCRSRL